ncbi:MAG: aldo/keto reductase, partial [Chthoniobacteraceae bacterium]
MKTVTIGPAGMRVSSIGLGCVTFGREIDEAAAHVLLDYTHAQGVCHFDTAAAYGDGASERILGNWLASRRPAAGSVSIATKILPPYEPARIEESVERSLERMAVPAIDLLYLHRWDATAESPSAPAALHGLVQAGKIRVLGVSNFNMAQLAAALTLQEQNGLEPFRVVQNNHNLAVSDVGPEFRA